MPSTISPVQLHWLGRRLALLLALNKLVTADAISMHDSRSGFISGVVLRGQVSSAVASSRAPGALRKKALHMVL